MNRLAARDAPSKFRSIGAFLMLVNYAGLFALFIYAAGIGECVLFSFFSLS